ncbi:MULTISPECIES: KTSC domain-containing protein [Photorhabdus]|uniref:KTSC domain-containing protein n=1 Tax=Photorhabdus kayaii TaxID=230088 RepID=A0ABX0AVJ9_9GAMM|nr:MULTISPECIES: KTSC domain-containing protein [Photorhabdus]MCC8376737.1 KTSC domain-containing protein [Photorhabdus bodei]MCT8354761.1 KTSC domain-containing protein [Photorhabdus kayaii]NDL14393.1 KTSC domain-containing protein [Photorhabdus kayaii]NDL23931.1 KTSC domain-containing protein [Photorhabdus kayaii]RAX12527.1 KTSC domain-containing protein [Photorhabdus sp. HUG-39]
MNRVPVSSSNLHSVGYNQATKTLEIAFRDGGIYQYYGVPPQIHQGLMNAPSKGRYFHKHIKDVYSYRK